MYRENKTKRKKQSLLSGKAEGSVTVEAAYLLPMLISVFFLTLYTVFYYHDKVIINAAAGEAAAAGAAYGRQHMAEEVDLTGFYAGRAEEKLILLRLDHVSADITKDGAEVFAAASCGRMCASADCRAFIARPEKKIREKRRVEALIGKEAD